MTTNDQERLRRELESTLRREEADLDSKINLRRWIVWIGVVILFFGINIQCSEAYKQYDHYEKNYYSDIPVPVQWLMIIVIGGAIVGALMHTESYSSKLRKELHLKQEAARKALRGED